MWMTQEPKMSPTTSPRCIAKECLRPSVSLHLVHVIESHSTTDYTRIDLAIP